MRARDRDLMGVLALTLAAGLAVASDAPVAITAALVLPLVLFVPGYVWSEALVGRDVLERDLRLVLAVALSMSVTALGAIVLYVLDVRLDRQGWLTLLVDVTLVGVAAAYRVRQERTVATPRSSGPSRPRRSLARATPWVLAAVLASAALALAIRSAQQQTEPAYTALSVVPAGTAAQGSVDVEVVNRERRTERYRLVVRVADNASRTLAPSLAAGESWRTTVPVNTGQHVVIDLYRAPFASRPYRHVDLTMTRPGAD